MNGVEGCLNERGQTIQEDKECVKDRKEWYCRKENDVHEPE